MKITTLFPLFTLKTLHLVHSLVPSFTLKQMALFLAVSNLTAFYSYAPIDDVSVATCCGF